MCLSKINMDLLFYELSEHDQKLQLLLHKVHKMPGTKQNCKSIKLYIRTSLFVQPPKHTKILFLRKVKKCLNDFATLCHCFSIVTFSFHVTDMAPRMLGPKNQLIKVIMNNRTFLNCPFFGSPLPELRW